MARPGAPVIHRVGLRRQLWRLAAAGCFVVVGETTPSGSRDWIVPIVAALGGFASMDRATREDR